MYVHVFLNCCLRVYVDLSVVVYVYLCVHEAHVCAFVRLVCESVCDSRLLAEVIA